MDQKTMIELFCGKGNIARAFSNAGFLTFKVDIRRRKGVCEPDLRKDVLLMSGAEIPFKKCHVLWASLPCDVWSYAANCFHWKNGIPVTKKTMVHLEILFKTLFLIDKIQPDIFFIENPRGRLRHYKPFLYWLEKYLTVEKIVTLSSYGYPTTKPTSIFTNCFDWKPKELDRFGRGAKCSIDFNNLTTVQRQELPGTFCDEIAAASKLSLLGAEIE